MSKYANERHIIQRTLHTKSLRMELLASWYAVKILSKMASFFSAGSESAAGPWRSFSKSWADQIYDIDQAKNEPQKFHRKVKRKRTKKPDAHKSKEDNVIYISQEAWIIYNTIFKALEYTKKCFLTIKLILIHLFWLKRKRDGYNKLRN